MELIEIPLSLCRTPAERALFNALSPSIPKISSKGAVSHLLDPDGLGLTRDYS